MILSMSFKLTSVACVTVIEQNVIYQFQFLKIDYFLLRIRMSVFINNQYGKKILFSKSYGTLFFRMVQDDNLPTD